MSYHEIIYIDMAVVVFFLVLFILKMPFCMSLASKLCVALAAPLCSPAADQTLPDSTTSTLIGG